MNIHLFTTLEEQAQGLQYLDVIDPDTIYVFPNVGSGVEFHSMNVSEVFDIAFLDKDYFVLALVRMRPPNDRIRTPEGTTMAVEARAGKLHQWGFVPGRRMSPMELEA